MNAVEREDPAALIKLPGIGKKTAERLIVEMKDRFKGLHGDLFTPAADLVLTSRARLHRMMMPSRKRLPRWWRWAINLRRPAGW